MDDYSMLRLVNMQMSQIAWPSPYEGEVTKQWPAADIYSSRPLSGEFCTVISGCMVNREVNQSKRWISHCFMSQINISAILQFSHFLMMKISKLSKSVANQSTTAHCHHSGAETRSVHCFFITQMEWVFLFCVAGTVSLWMKRLFLHHPTGT
jgi:hypothetical protein